MKKNNLMIGFALLLISLFACKAPATKAQQDLINLTNYVDSVKRLTPVYTSAYWAMLDNGYQIRLAKTANSLEELQAAEKARLEESKIQYALLKKEYELRMNNNGTISTVTATDHRTALRNQLFGEGVIGADMSFSFATAGNLLSIYRNFVNTVDANKNKYTREDWDEIKVLYEALDSRKNTVEKQLPKGDNRKIGGLKLKFGLIKATHRDGAKADENKAAKEKQ